MNLKTNGWIKNTIILLLTILAGALSAADLNMYLEHNRFLDEKGNTVHQFNYKIPNNELSFTESEDGFLALLDVTISSETGTDEKTKLKEFTRYIGVRNKELALSSSNYYLDKISLTLSKSDYVFYLNFIDKVSGKQYTWSKKLENIQPDALVSDIEFSHQINKNRPHPGMELFVRGNYQFYVDPVHIYHRNIQDTVFFYYEIQNLTPAVDQHSYYSENITIYSDTDTLTIENHVKSASNISDRIHRVPISSLPDGYYNIDISVHDRVRNRKETTSNYFVLTEKTIQTQRLFHDPEKEHQILRYFLPATYFSNWEDMSETAKANLIDKFWRQNDPDKQSEENEFLQAVRTRINYANHNFPRHGEGWETDLGRIYIRNGEPNEIEKNFIEGDIKLTRREYQIWRYRSLNRVYLFVDIQGTGNYRLIYNKNDDMELTSHDWERYVGDEFDTNLLEQ